MANCAWSRARLLLAIILMRQSRPRRSYKLLALLVVASFLASAAGAQNKSAPGSKPPSTGKGYKTAQLLYLDITTDQTGAVSRVEFINKVPDDIQAWIRNKIMGRHFGIANHTYRRVVELQVPR